MIIRQTIETLIRGEDLTAEQMRQVFEKLTAGELTDVQIAAVLTALACKKPTPIELAAAVRVMRQCVLPVPLTVDAIDTCGTGGDGISTFNVSTCAALIAAGAGAYVAKHGNRTNSRHSGSAEVLGQLGVNLDASAATVTRCIEQGHIGFLFAIKSHPAMKHAVNARKQLGVRTMFNMLGPLTSPSGVRRQIVGVPRPEETELVAGALRELGVVHAMVVHGLDGLCDLSIAGPSLVCEVQNDSLRTYEVHPTQLGIDPAPISEILVHNPAESAERTRAVLGGQKGPSRDIATLNAAAALVVAGLAKDLADGLAQARHSIDSGAANRTLDTLIQLSNG